jgi:hypothetical protein
MTGSDRENEIIRRARLRALRALTAEDDEDVQYLPEFRDPEDGSEIRVELLKPCAELCEPNDLTEPCYADCWSYRPACKFHPDCCGPADTSCTGCGKPAVKILWFARVNFGPRALHPDDARRMAPVPGKHLGTVPVCAAHEHAAREAFEAAWVRQRGEAN